MALQIPRDWRLQAARYRLLGGKCRRCGRVTVPERPVCPGCGASDMETVKLSGRGEVYSYTVMYKVPDSFERSVPYVVALVRLEEEVLISAQITDADPDEVMVGLPVEVVFRQWRQNGADGHIVYGYKFRPLLVAPAEDASGA